jgi:hypothetical protein
MMTCGNYVAVQRNLTVLLMVAALYGLGEMFCRVWCRELAFGLWAMFEAGRRNSHGQSLLVMANVIEIFSCAACVSLIMMWSLDLLASLFNNSQKFKIKQ